MTTETKVHESCVWVLVGFSFFVVWVLHLHSSAGCDTRSASLQSTLDQFETKRQATLGHTTALESMYASRPNPTKAADIDAFAEAWKAEWDKVKAEVNQLGGDV